SASYGTPAELKSLVQAAHRLGLMVLLDVVYNHFGPEGNYLHLYASPFFTDAHQTPWGAAIDFAGPDSRAVRDFFVHNALFWLVEYRMDGLRLDAVHAIHDDSDPDILEELAAAVQAGPGRERAVHLVLENDANETRYLERAPSGAPRGFVAQWNDDIHHACHCLLTGEEEGYYADYAAGARDHLGRCLTEGFAYQGERSGFREGAQRGSRSAHLPLTAFVGFLQNHDQIGNRALGERLTALADPRAVRAALTLLLLAPAPPLLFMGEEYGSRQPFLFFCDFGPDLAESVTAGRRREFARFPQFADPAAAERIPDPQARKTFARSRLDWEARERGDHAAWRAHVHAALDVRQRAIVPHLPGLAEGERGWSALGRAALQVVWQSQHGPRLIACANLSARALCGMVAPPAPLLLESERGVADALAAGRLPAASVAWFLDSGGGGTA
ncbi:MAG: DUF3459 domain-containing protein, partial [Candidatus Eisenbacteria bacterium]|nr:DUF3459 domain-containing protein [Candidatus Eisenbacteria bacterium]